MNRYPLWKYILLLSVLGLGFIFALPNLFVPDPAVQVKGYAAGFELDESTVERIKTILEDNDIAVKRIELNDGAALVRLTKNEDQLVAKKELKIALNNIKGAKSDTYIVALNRASNTPQWLADLGGSPMNLGLDLAGGVHFVLEVDTPQALKDRLADMQDAIKKEIFKRKLYKTKVERKGQAFVITAETYERQNEVANMLKEEFGNLQRNRGTTPAGKFFVKASVTPQEVKDIENHAVSQNLTTLRNRVNELGVSEPLVQRQGRNRIVVELPGVQDTAEAERILGKTANLEFRLEAKEGASSSRKEYFDRRNSDENDRFGGAYLEKRPIITGESVKNAKRGFDQETSQPQVNISLDAEGGKKMYKKTAKNVGERLGVLFIEYLPRTKSVINEDGERVNETILIPQKTIISLATIQSALGREFRTTGLSDAEAGELALLLRAGALAAPMIIVEQSTIGPSLGQENINLGVTSVQLGLGLVVLFMFVYYRAFGFAANLALSANIILLAAFMSMFGATLTLPGIAGIVLTVGMAVDANVLIFSRIKEEIKNGVPPQSAIASGFDRAFTTILDANITTLIVAVILFAIGSGPIKGFAVTLSIGILTSMFTAIIGTRAVVNLMYGNRKIEKLWI